MIAIPNMEKPKRCLECWSGLSIDINCEAGAGFWNANGDRVPPDCPIIEVVPCKECKHRKVYALQSDSPMEKWCHRWSVPRLVTDNDFCSYGDRGDNG